MKRLSIYAHRGGAPIVIIEHESQDGPLYYGSEGWNVAHGLEALPTDTYVRKSFGPKVRAVPASEVRIEV